MNDASPPPTWVEGRKRRIREKVRRRVRRRQRGRGGRGRGGRRGGGNKIEKSVQVVKERGGAHTMVRDRDLMQTPTSIARGL